MRRILTSRIFLVVLTAIIVATGSVYATIRIQADEIGYQDGTVEDALNNLYSKTTGTSFCKRITGNSTTIGSKYECDPGDGIYRIFYVLKVNDDTVDLIMDKNINKGTMNWNTAMQYVSSNNLKTSWSNARDVTLPKAQDIADAVGNTSWNVDTATADSWFYLDKYNGDFQNSIQVANSANLSAYSWLYNNTRECANNGCDINTSLDSTGAYGYWTQNQVFNSNYAWDVVRGGQMGRDPISDAQDIGVRPVITVLKSDLAG